MGAWFWWMIFGMAVVTYIPRAIPLTFLEGRELPEAVQNVLRNIPYAVLGALIFPAVFFIQENVWFGVIGAASAFASCDDEDRTNNPCSKRSGGKLPGNHSTSHLF